MERVGTSVRVSVSVNGSDHSAGLTVTLEGPAVPGSLHVPSSGSAPPPPPPAPSPPRPAPAPGPYRQAPLQPVLRRPLLLPSLSAARDRPRRPPTPPPLPASTTAEIAGESRLGSPGTRGRHRGGGPGLAASGRLFPPAARTAQLAAFLPCLGSGNPMHTPKRYFYKGGYDEWALEM